MKQILLIFILLNVVSSCSVSKEEIWPCLQEYDMNNDAALNEQEIKTMLQDKLSWYEKLVYSPTYVTNLIKVDCGIPLNKNNFDKKSCFKMCLYITTVKGKIC